MHNSSPVLKDQDFRLLLKSRCIGLTGGIATGKSTVAKILRDLGYIVIDADQLARDIVKPGAPTLLDIAKAFGSEIMTPSNELNRDKLREIVMSDPQKRALLEGITHPAIQLEFKHAVERLGLSEGSDVFFYEAALLFEAGRDHLFRDVWATTCSKNEQISRLMSRSTLSREAAEKIISSQMPTDVKAAKANRVIDTSCSLQQLKLKIEDLIKTLKS